MSNGIGEKELLERLAELPREKTPRRDPWPQILKRISAEQGAGRAHRRGWWAAAVAASAVLAVAMGLMLNPSRMDAPGPIPASKELARGDSSASGHPLGVVLEASEAEYRAAFKEFTPLGRARENLPVQAVEKIESGWNDLVNAEFALTTALAENPEDQFLHRKMLELRNRQLGFLRQLATLDSSDRRLNI